MSWLQGGSSDQAQAQQQPQMQSTTSVAQQMMAAQEAELTFMTEFYNKYAASARRETVAC